LKRRVFSLFLLFLLFNSGKHNFGKEQKMIKSTVGQILLATSLLVLLTGSAGASGVCVWGDIDAGEFYVCGDTVTKSCTLNDTMTCKGDGLIIGSGQIRIYGEGYCIKGDGTDTGIYNPGSSTFFELHDLGVKNFETGIKLRHVTGTTIYNYLIDNSTVHNSTTGIEIDDIDLRMCIIEQCEFHHNCQGIYVHGANGTHIRIINNKVHDNTVSGIHSEGICADCYIEYNVISKNGRGIALNASQWTLYHNLVTNNSGSGILVKGGDNILRYNTVGNNNEGIHIAECFEDITLEINTFCDNKERDVFVDSMGNVSGDENACEITENYNDAGTSGCTYHCTGCIDESGIVHRCGGIVTESCTFNANIICPEGDGLIVWASGTEEAPLVIDGAEHAIDGIAPGDSMRTGIYNPNAHDYVTIKNIEVTHFHNGIDLGSSPGSPGMVEHNVIDNCKVHDNGEPDAFYTHGIATYHAKNCTITHCDIYNNTGTGCGSCEDGGRGLLLYGPGDHNNVTHNRIYGNGMVGIYSKMMSQHNYVAHNDVYKNGKHIPEGVDTYAPGGIALACKLTNYWIVEHNNITNNIGSGIYIGGSYNIIRYNDIKDSKNAPAGEVGYGINGGRSDGSHDNEIYKNTVCENEDSDIRMWSSGAGNHGTENTCDTTYNYDDDGTTGCTYSCGTKTSEGDLNGDGIITPADAVIVLQMAVSGEYSEDADVSGDSMVTSLDALMIMQWAAGL
jgi:parallel beta-helix repeat protein